MAYSMGAGERGTGVASVPLYAQGEVRAVVVDLGGVTRGRSTGRRVATTGLRVRSLGLVWRGAARVSIRERFPPPRRWSRGVIRRTRWLGVDDLRRSLGRRAAYLASGTPSGDSSVFLRVWRLSLALRFGTA